MVLKLAVITTLSMLTACRDKQTLPIVHAAGASPRAAGQKQSPADIYGPLHKPGIDMREITHELYKNAPPQFCYSFTRRRTRDQNAQVPCKHGWNKRTGW
jgi:hypothetical protein